MTFINNNLRKIVTLFLTVFSMMLSAQEISLLTVDQGDMIYDTYGHSALRVRDASRNFDNVYNYGLYDFNTPGFIMKFMRGKLLYQVGAHRYDSFLYNYKLDKRSVYEQKLNLTQEEKDALLKALRINMLEENKYYKYDFFFDNCSTRLRDLIESSVDSTKLLSQPNELTFRDQIKEYQFGKPWEDFGIDIIIGAKADEPANIKQQMFLPIYLKDLLAEEEIVRVDTIVPLLGPVYEVMTFPEEAAKRKIRSLFNPELVFGILSICILLVVWPYRKEKELPKWLQTLSTLYLLILGILGCIVAFMWWGTDHVATKSNWNLLWLSPLLLLIVIFRNNKYHWVKYIIYLMLITCTISFANVWFQFLPQQFHIGFAWMILIEIIFLLLALKRYK